MIKIALTGVAGVGKGLVSEIIQELCVGSVKTSFAYPIKEFLRRLLKLTDDHLYGVLKEVPMTFFITPESLDDAAAFYYEYGIDDLVSFDRMMERFEEVLQDNLIKGEQTVIHGLSSRRLQQLLGTEIIRYFRDTTWVDLGLKQEANIIDDLRFLNEAKALTAAGYKIVRITGKATRITDSAAKVHASELDIDLIHADYEINNYHEVYDDSSRILLKQKVKSMLITLYP